MDTLCHHCDCYVGLGGAGVFLPPTGDEFDPAWLASHCWGCGRSEDEVKAQPHGRPTTPFHPGRVMPERGNR